MRLCIYKIMLLTKGLLLAQSQQLIAGYVQTFSLRKHFSQRHPAREVMQWDVALKESAVAKTIDTVFPTSQHT